MSRPYDYAGTPGGGSYYSVNNAENSQQPIYSPAHHNDSSALLANGGSGSGGAYPPGGAPVPKPYGSNGAKPWYKKPAVLWTAAIILVVGESISLIDYSLSSAVPVLFHCVAATRRACASVFVI